MLEILGESHFVAYCVEKLGFAVMPIFGEDALRSIIVLKSHARMEWMTHGRANVQIAISPVSGN